MTVMQVTCIDVESGADVFPNSSTEIRRPVFDVKRNRPDVANAHFRCVIRLAIACGASVRQDDSMQVLVRPRTENTNSSVSRGLQLCFGARHTLPHIWSWPMLLIARVRRPPSTSWAVKFKRARVSRSVPLAPLLARRTQQQAELKQWIGIRT
jgi:hypothetical protein